MTKQQTVRMLPISIIRDLGEKAELREGLKGGEQLVINPPPDLENGQKVHVIRSAQTSSEAGAPHGGTKSKS